MVTEETPLISPPQKPSNPDHTSFSLKAGNLARFRDAIGISSTSDLESGSKTKPHGLYKDILNTQRRLSIQACFISCFHYLALIAQILIGAVLATLGSASRLHPTSIMVLGIVNTSTAGFLALLKGQGLPDRLRKNAYQMRKVRDFIEEVDIRLELHGDVTDEELEKLVQLVFENYKLARDTAEINRPASYAQQVKTGPENGDVNRDTGAGSSGLLEWGRGSATETDGCKGKGKFIID